MVSDELHEMLDFAAGNFQPTPAEVDAALAATKQRAEDLLTESASPTHHEGRRRRTTRRITWLGAAAVFLAIVILAVQTLLPSTRGGLPPVLASGVTPDGRSVFVEREGEAPVITPLPEDAENARVSPDGTRVAYDSPSPGPEADHDIFVLTIGVDTPDAVVAGPDFDIAPSWSPDGMRLAFIRQVGAYTDDGGDFACAPCSPEIAILNIGGGVQVLDTSVRTSAPVSWSRDGSWLAYPAVTDGGGWAMGIHPAGSGEEQIVDCEGFCGSPTWAPDDRSLAMFEGKVSLDPLYQLTLVDPVARSRMPLTNGQVSYSAAAWAPSGNLIAALGRAPDGRYGVYVVDASNGASDRIADVANSRWGVAWTSDGQIIYQDRTPEGPALFTISPDGSAPTPLVIN